GLFLPVSCGSRQCTPRGAPRAADMECFCEQRRLGVEDYRGCDRGRPDAMDARLGGIALCGRCHLCAGIAEVPGTELEYAVHLRCIHTSVVFPADGNPEQFGVTHYNTSCERIRLLPVRRTAGQLGEVRGYSRS